MIVVALEDKVVGLCKFFRMRARNSSGLGAAPSAEDLEEVAVVVDRLFLLAVLRFPRIVSR